MTFQQYGDELRSDFAAKVCQVPARDDKAKPVAASPSKPVENKAKQEINKVVVEKKDETGSKIKTKKLILKETFMCSCQDFYNVSGQKCPIFSKIPFLSSKMN